MNIRLVGGAFLNFLYNDVITHVPIHAVRKGFLRLFNNKIDRHAVILMHTRILNFWKIEIGPNVVINQHCLLDCRQYRIVIAHNTDIGPYTRIWTLGHDPDSPNHALYGGDVQIGHHVWIASGVTILPKAVIGDGAVIASASVVIKPVQVKEVVAGNPAKHIRFRNNELSYQLKFTPYFE
ncbi:acyltransferase [Pinibacter soli]|uniref:Acyltransferase n=1 Tax=Pinibacter soli TaxID=3044211 RepID=A0ABT6R7S5_9BACT|nr:acyltransferase [Pinibacter soli]MDI3318622.1 acyltransferase [Pinibacter soli]